MALATTNDCTTTADALTTKHRLLDEKIQPHFNHFQFFFDSSHIQQLARSDRRFLQRIYREKAYSNVNAFYAIDCEEEEEIPEKFREIYQAVLETGGSAIRAYQLIVNTLTFCYSRLTWATSVQKYVLQFLVDSILCNFHRTFDAGERSLFELELVCLLELFVLRYASGLDCEQLINEETVAQLFSAIRDKEGEEYLVAFVRGHILNHFGCSLDRLLRRIVERLDIKVKTRCSAGFGRGRKLSLSTSELAAGRNGGRCGSSVKGTSSEPVPSDGSTPSDSNGMDEERRMGRSSRGSTPPAATATVGGIGTGRRQRPATAATTTAPSRQRQQNRRRRPQQRQRDGHSSSVCIDVKQEEEEQEEDERFLPSSPPAKHLRSGTNAAGAASRKVVNRRGGAVSRKRNYPRSGDNISERSNRSSSSSNCVAATAAAAFCASQLSVATAPNFPVTRSATAHASAAGSSRSSSSTNTTTTTNASSSRLAKTPRSSLPSRAKHSMASSLGVRCRRF